ncbi:protein-tyrosine phosphatase-like protein [Amylocarpus encephaloides]|uniref:Protein-tyrosine phosphatase-like protein n=1 Tax=Amylocarpus encephaloides TaxID=45428 RepID=A0A9P8C4K7_9HELO|nr:protein-tyrosine phosphatase-like protein [Amylocarpus encephaloides]
MTDKLKIAKVEDVKILAGGETQIVRLHLTAHHLIFVFTPPPPPSPPLGTDAPKKSPRPRETWIAYALLSFCTYRPTPPGSGHQSSIKLRTRDFRFLTMNFVEDKQARDVFESMKSCTCRLGAIDKLYAFGCQVPPQEREINGWVLYDAKAEWKRQGISEKDVDRGWRISKINVDYAFSPTYPALLPVPSAISDNVLNYAGRYRSRERIPALTYLHPVNNCSIIRCSQPLAGLRGNRSIQDEKLVSACFSACASLSEQDLNSSTTSGTSPASSQTDLDLPSAEGNWSETERLEDEIISASSKLEIADAPHIYGAQQHNLIVDARPTVNALAMQAVGLGSENMDHYKFATKVYLGIDNIHVMRKSLNGVIEAIKDSDVSKSPPNRDLLAKSGWLKHITGLLDGSALIARQVGIQHSHVLIHCSDGWDRTSQLSALAQLMLDPYYRTIDGFIVLVEKDWLSFGHMFQLRSGFLNSEKWFKVQNDALAGSAIHPTGSGDGRGDAIENALLSARRFFNKGNSSLSQDNADAESGDLLEDTKSAVKQETAAKEATDPGNISPVFHQFLDATYQLMHQHPTRFEFNERFLKRLLYHLYSCQYGTFLYNNEKTRLDAKVQERTHSVWGYFLSQRGGFTNPQYDGGEIDDHVKGKERLIFPKLDKVRWWHESFYRTDAEMNGPSNPATEKYLGGDVTPSRGRSSPSPRSSSSNSGLNKSVLTGVETAHAALTVDRKMCPTRGLANGESSSFASLRDGIAGLGIERGNGASGSAAGNGGKSPSNGAKGELEVEMQ